MQLGLGTAAIGRPEYINIRAKSHEVLDLNAFKKQGFNVLEEAYKLGVRYFDTAPGYGMAETLLLEWLQTKNDPTIIIATKWGYTYVANFNPNAKVHEVKAHSLEKLNEQWNVSKAFSSHLKVYQIHSATLETGVLENEKVLHRLAQLKAECNIKIGITTTGENQIEVIKKALESHIEGEQLFDAFQITFNVLDQSLINISEDLIRSNKQIIIKEALANGRLFRTESYNHYRKLYNLLDELALKYKTTADAVLLKFCTQTIPNSIVLSGASNGLHLLSNLKMNAITLANDDIEKLLSFKISPSKYWDERKRLKWN